MGGHFITTLILTVVAAFVSPPSSSGAEIEGCYFDDTYFVGETKFRLTGVGLLRFWGFKAYTGKKQILGLLKEPSDPISPLETMTGALPYHY